MDTLEIVQHWLNQIKRIPPEGYLPIADFSAFHSRARTESSHWCQLLFSQQANPHTPANQARHKYYPASGVKLDLLCHQYAFAGNSIAVYEGVNFIIAQIPPTEARPWNPKKVDEFLQGALNHSGTPPPFTFAFPESIEEGKLISSAPNVDPTMMPSLADRLDLLAQNGSLYVIAYKRYPGLLGVRHDGQWFEKKLRQPRQP